MPIEFQLPNLGSGHQEAEIVAWHVEIGEIVRKGEPLCSVETEKSVIEIPAPATGPLLATAGPVGTAVEIGELLAVIGDNAEEETSVQASSEAVVQGSAGKGGANGARPLTLDSEGITPNDGEKRERVLATPKAREAARLHGIDIATISGTGPIGRITHEDVMHAAEAERSLRRERMSPLRRAIASHMMAQWQTTPHITIHLEANASPLAAVRSSIAARLGVRVPFDALLIRACLSALRDFPEMNASVEGEEILLRECYDIGFAVATAHGLVVPVVRSADRISLRELVEEVSQLAAKALNRKLGADEQHNQTFTVSNLGAVGGGHATQIIPRDTTAILSFGRAKERPMLRHGVLESILEMPISGTFDHRAVDGARAALFIRSVAASVEDLASLALELDGP